MSTETAESKSPMPSIPARLATALRTRAKVIAASMFLFVIVVWVFFPAVHNSYVNYDDPEYLINNVRVQGGLTWVNVKWAFSTTAVQNWHPLTWISHMLDCELFGPRLWGHHLMSVLLHGSNVVLVFLLLYFSTGSLHRSLIVAAFFGLHPLRVESVAWLSERKDVLSAFFGLAALVAYVSYSRGNAAINTPTSVQPRRLLSGLLGAGSSIHYWIAVFLFIGSLLSKPMMVTLPFVMLLMDYWPMKRATGKDWWLLVLEKVPFLVLSAITAVVTILVQRTTGAMDLMAHYSVGQRFANSLVSYARYLGKFLWPEHLSPIYPVVPNWPLWQIAGAAGLLLFITLVFTVLRTKAPYGLTGWLWFLGTLVPVIGLVAVGEQAMADRYTYFPLIGITVVLIWGIADVTSPWRGLSVVLNTGYTGLAVACIVITRQQVGVWADSETLFRHSLAVTKNNYSAHANLASALQEGGRTDDALFHYREAVRLRPDSAESLNNLGAILGMTGRENEAIQSFKEALRLSPRYADAHRNLAIALTRQGELLEAIDHYAQAVQLKPNQPVFRNDYGKALANLGRIDEAITQFQKAIQLEAGYAEAHGNLAKVLSLQGRSAEAEIHHQEAIRLNASSQLR